MGRGAHRYLPRQAAEPQPQGPGGRAYRAVARPGASTDSGAATAHSMPRAWYTHGACLVYAWRIGQAQYVLGRRRTMAGTCATVGGSYRPSGSPRARPRCSGTRSPRRCTPRRCNAAGSECLGSQRPVAAQRSRCPLTCSGPPSGPQPRFGDCRVHSVLRFAEPGPRRRWARMRRPRCNDTTPSARRRNPRPAWSWDEAPRVGTCSALLLGVRPGTCAGLWSSAVRGVVDRRHGARGESTHRHRTLVTSSTLCIAITLYTYIYNIYKVDPATRSGETTRSQTADKRETLTDTRFPSRPLGARR